MSQEMATPEIETAEPELDIDIIRKIRAFNAELCKAYPPQFLHFLADHSDELVEKWLLEHAAPDSILDLRYNAKALEQLARAMEAGKVDRIALEMGIETIPETVNLIVQLGGKFTGPAGIIP
jgi:hypothetical protein